MAAGVQAATAPPPPAVGVLTAARDLPAGAVIGSDDLVHGRLRPGLGPEPALTGDVVGRTLAAPVRRGEPVTDVRLVGPALTAGDPELTAVPVRLPDAGMVELLDVGDRIDLIGTDPQGVGASRGGHRRPGAGPAPVRRRTRRLGSARRPGGRGRRTDRGDPAGRRRRALFLTYAFSH